MTQLAHSLVVYNDESEVTQQLGQEEYLRVRNNSGSTILNGSGVRITGSLTEMQLQL